MEFLYIAGIFMMGAIALKIGYVIYKNFKKVNKTENNKNLDL